MKSISPSVFSPSLLKTALCRLRNHSLLYFIRQGKWASMIAFLLAHLTVNAQTYLPLPTSNVQWNCTYAQGWVSGGSWGFDGNEMSYITSGDTLIAGNTYCKLTKSVSYISDAYYSGGGHYHSSNYIGVSYAGCYRNDSIAKRVYFVPADSSNEKLLYDFSIQLGDTIGEWWNSDNIPLNYTIIVEAEDSVLIDGVYRRRLSLTPTGHGQGYLIEGIGSTFGLLNPLMYFENFGDLNCFSVNGQTLYPDSTSPCILVDQINDPSATSHFSIHPNPANEFIYLRLPFKNSRSSSYEITDCTGKILHKGNLLLQNETEKAINISNLPAGFYFLSIQNDKERQTSRFVKY